MENKRKKAKKRKTKFDYSKSIVFLCTAILFIFLGFIIIGLSSQRLNWFGWGNGSSHELEVINYNGIDFSLPAHWITQEVDGSLVSRIRSEETIGIILIDPMSSNIELTLEENYGAISALINLSSQYFRQNNIYISSLPARKHQYQVLFGEEYYNIVGFLFPNSEELLYFQIGFPAIAEPNADLIEEITTMIFNLNLPPSEFR